MENSSWHSNTDIRKTRRTSSVLLGAEQFGERNEEERNREWEPGREEQSGRRGFSGHWGGESEQSGWRRDSDEDRWGQGGESRGQGQDYGRGETYGRGQQQGYGSSGQSQGGYGGQREQYGQRERGGYGGGGMSTSAGDSVANSNAATENFASRVAPPQRSGVRKSPLATDVSTNPSHSNSRIRLVFRATSDHPSAPARSGLGGEGYSGYGAHRGKGPKGYTRSDDRLKEVICEKLSDDPMIDASEISIEVTSQVVKLTGTVDDRATKYEVEELIERCGGVKDIDNQLRVRSRYSQSSQLGSQGGSIEAAGTGTSQTTGSGASQTSQSAKEGSSGSSGTRRGNN